MANEKNLSRPTSEQARERGRKGGIASGKSRRDKKTLRQALELLLEIRNEKTGRSGMESVALALFDKAISGDVRAIETLRDSIGQKPTDKVMQQQVGKIALRWEWEEHDSVSECIDKARMQADTLRNVQTPALEPRYSSIQWEKDETPSEEPKQAEPPKWVLEAEKEQEKKRREAVARECIEENIARNRQRQGRTSAGYWDLNSMDEW